MRKKFLVKQKYLLILKIKNKMKNLQEMSLNEMRKTEGGIAPWLISAEVWIADNWDDLVKGNERWKKEHAKN